MSASCVLKSTAETWYNYQTKAQYDEGRRENKNMTILIDADGCPVVDLTPVSYTHLDVYKRQLNRFLTFFVNALTQICFADSLYHIQILLPDVALD